MNLEFLLKYVKSVTDLQALQTISKEVQQRYHQLVQKKRLGNAELRVGDTVSFHTRGGKKIRGRLERRGKVNFRIAAEDGAIYRVPMLLLNKETPALPLVAPQMAFPLENIIPFVIDESKRLLYQVGIELHVRYKKGVWSTHFRHNRHIQFGEKCLRYQIMLHKTSDNVAANLRKFRIPSEPESRIAMLICHEVAHAIAHQRYGLNILPHGRQYYRVLSELVESEFQDIHERCQHHVANAAEMVPS
ncbi:MAG: hypothetical protein H6695_06735 [Deferribacteres bacterium]|nr:hypothetical protein [candidate division KSB1 bacterium]MCB9509858.1 hypothetical protein [Deferribacteres bacterium]